MQTIQNLSPFILTIIWNSIIASWIILVVLITKFFKNIFEKKLEYITATTVWLLLWIIFLWFLPKLTTKWHLVWQELWIFILIWVFIFYLLELFLHWHHCKDLWHDTSCKHSKIDEHNSNKNWILMFWGTIMHNAFHWIVLFSAFSVSFSFWMATTTAVLLHSIPQNVVNYIMNNKKIWYSYLAAFWWLLWTFLVYPFSDFLIANKFYILAIISWWLLYTALADIFPEFKWKWNTFKKFSYLFFIVIWILLFLWFEMITK